MWSSSSLKFLEWPKQQRHHEDHTVCVMLWAWWEVVAATSGFMTNLLCMLSPSGCLPSTGSALFSNSRPTSMGLYLYLYLVSEYFVLIFLQVASTSVEHDANNCRLPWANVWKHSTWNLCVLVSILLIWNQSLYMVRWTLACVVSSRLFSVERHSSKFSCMLYYNFGKKWTIF